MEPGRQCGNSDYCDWDDEADGHDQPDQGIAPALGAEGQADNPGQLRFDKGDQQVVFRSGFKVDLPAGPTEDSCGDSEADAVVFSRHRGEKSETLGVEPALKLGEFGWERPHQGIEMSGSTGELQEGQFIPISTSGRRRPQDEGELMVTVLQRD